jgi:hypothetical protein
MSFDGKISAKYKEIMSILELIESKIVLEFDNLYGYLTCKPLNSASAFEIRLLYEDVDLKAYKKEADHLDLAASKFLNKSLEIFNKNKVHLSHAEILRKFMNFLHSSNI